MSNVKNRERLLSHTFSQLPDIKLYISFELCRGYTLLLDHIISQYIFTLCISLFDLIKNICSTIF